MKITVENLGVIKKGSVEIPENGGMTIFAGANNSGKSYMSYLVYGYYKILSVDSKYNNISNKYRNTLIDRIEEIETLNSFISEKGLRINRIDFFKRNFSKYLEIIQKSLEEASHSIFSNKSINYSVFITDKEPKIDEHDNYKSSFWGKSSFYEAIIDNEKYLSIYPTRHKVDRDELKEIAKKFLILHYTSGFHFFPAERSSINLFAKEIFKDKSLERDELARKIQLGHDLEKVLNEYKNNGTFVPRYPLPVSDYIYYVNDLAYAVEQPETDFADLADDLEEVMQGKVELSAFGDMQFKPKGRGNKKRLPLHLSSSLVKSLSGLVIYFRHLAKKGDVVMIDEPELNLHPENQVRLARVLAKIANRGFNLIFSTHSDYILKELSNLTIMSNDFEGKEDLIQEYNYDEQSFLTKDKINVYAFQNQTIEEVEITEEGFDLDKIDEVISDLSQRSNNIRFSFLESEAVYE